MRIYHVKSILLATIYIRLYHAIIIMVHLNLENIYMYLDISRTANFPEVGGNSISVIARVFEEA